MARRDIDSWWFPEMSRLTGTVRGSTRAIGFIDCLGLNRRTQGDGVDPHLVNQLPVDETLIRSGVQEYGQRRRLILPQEGGTQ